MQPQPPQQPPQPPYGAPQFPYAQQYPNPQQPFRPASARTSTGILVAALAGGVLLGAAGVGVAWAVSGGTGGGAQGDARAACGQLALVDDLKVQAAAASKSAHPLDLATVDRWDAAAILSDAAAAESARYKGLSQAIKESFASVGMYTGVSPRSLTLLATARKACAGV